MTSFPASSTLIPHCFILGFWKLKDFATELGATDVEQLETGATDAQISAGLTSIPAHGVQ
jgi:hypothetical protein